MRAFPLEDYSGQMSSIDPAPVVDLTVQRSKRAKLEACELLLDAAVELLRESPFDAITVSAVGERAGISRAATAEMFSSRSELIVAICLRRIRGVSLSTDDRHGSIARVADQLSEMMLVVSEEPALAAACAAVFLDSDAAADGAREQIGMEIHRLIASAVGPGSWPEVIATLELVFSGALIQAAAGSMSFPRAADRVQTAVSLILEGVPQR